MIEKNVKYVLLLLGAVTFSSVQAQDRDCSERQFVASPCERNAALIEAYAIRTEMSELKDRRDNFERVNSADYSGLVDRFVERLNNVRACLRSIGETVMSCNVSFYGYDQLSSDITKETQVYNVRENSSGSCAKEVTTNTFNLLNNQNQVVVGYYNGHYSIQENIQCQDRSGTADYTERSFQFSGYREGVSSSKGYFMFMDWAESDAHDFKVSQHWAKQIQMGRSTTVNYVVDGSNINFEFSNGAQFSVNSNSRGIISSNFIESSNYTAQECQTDFSLRGSSSASRSSRVRFYPHIDLTNQFRRLSITTLTN